MVKDVKRKVTSAVLAITLFGGSVTLASCGSKLDNEVSSADKSASASVSGDPSLLDKSKFEKIDDLLFGDSDVVPTLGSAEELISPNSVQYDIRSEYNLGELFVIDAPLLNESLKGKKYITTTTCFSLNYVEKNVVFVCYPSINSDFILVHQIAFVNNEFSNVAYYSNISGGVSTDSNDMNTVISNAMIRPLSEKTDIPVLSLEEAQELVKKINDESKLTLN